MVVLSTNELNEILVNPTILNQWWNRVPQDQHIRLSYCPGKVQFDVPIYIIPTTGYN